MERKTNDRGFGQIRHIHYPPNGETPPVVTESSAIGEYDDSLERPGSSYLWVGADHHLSREQVREIVGAMNHWLETGKLFDR